MEDYLPETMQFGILAQNKLESIAKKMPRKRAEELRSAFAKITNEYGSLTPEQIYNGLVNFEATEKTRRRRIEKISYEEAYQRAMGRLQSTLSAEREFKEEFREFVSW